MSQGGSYGYPWAETDLSGLLAKRSHLHEMRDRLAGLGYAKDAALETEELILLMRQCEVRVEARLNRLTEVWRAVERWDSDDTDEVPVVQALAAYRDEPKPEVSSG